MWTNIFLLAFSLSLLNQSKGLITAFLGENKILQWETDPMPENGTIMIVLHPLIIGSGASRGYVTLYSVLDTTIVKSNNNQAKRVSNMNNSNSNTGNIDFTLSDIREEDGGDYRVRYTPIGDTTTLEAKGIRLIVYVKPSKPSITEVSPPVIFKDMTLNCVTQSNSKPDDHGLHMKYKWYRNGADLPTGDRYTSSGSQLQVKNIQKPDNKTVFSCEAFETESLKSNNSAEYTVDVQYGPDGITISPSNVYYTLKENDKLNKMTCTSRCNPACSYTWERDGIQVSSGQVLNAINKIKRHQAGQYVCKVANKHGRNGSIVTVVVQYSPDSPVLTINGNITNIGERLPITLTCTTQSVPLSMLTIHGSNMTRLNVKKNTLTSTFTIPHANCLDTGLFYCSAENNIGNSNSSGTAVNVLCKPRPDHRVSHTFKQGLKPGETMNISGTLISNPQPTIYWSMQSNEASVSTNLTNEDNFVVHNYWKIPTIKSKATRTDIKAEQFGNYSMHAVNEYGRSVMEFFVIPEQSPDGAELISVLCKPETTIEIKFKPKFDGGDMQTFSIGMKLESDSVFQTVGKKLLDNNEKEMTLRGPILEKGVSYVFEVYATNTFGTASSTNKLKCTIEKDFNMGAVIGGAVAGGVLIVAVIVIILILVKRRKRTEKSDVIESMNGRQPNAYQDEPEDGMKLNILYESAGPRDKESDKNGNAQKETPVNAVYAEVVKPKNKKANNDVYAEVVKQKGKGKTDGKKGKGKKSKPGQQNVDVYENAPKIAASQDQPSRRTNNKGLVYVDVEIKGNVTNQNKPVIHGIQNKNEYADVDFSRRADPLPSDDEDDTTTN